jgi:hypothetical protein
MHPFALQTIATPLLVALLQTARNDAHACQFWGCRMSRLELVSLVAFRRESTPDASTKHNSLHAFCAWATDVAPAHCVHAMLAADMRMTLEAFSSSSTSFAHQPPRDKRFTLKLQLQFMGTALRPLATAALEACLSLLVTDGSPW